jgi:hypothetical protein
MKNKETLEESSAEYANRELSQEFTSKVGNFYGFSSSFIKGAEWQQERMYSEEDMREAFKQSRQCKIFQKDMPPVHNTFEEWFNEFKKR